jgi:hypothetical protein
MICSAAHSERSEEALRCQVQGSFALLRMRTLSATLLFLACASPEAGRPLGGGAGADVKNWGRPVEFHDGAEPYHETPCVTEPVECHGPSPVFGPMPPPD